MLSAKKRINNIPILAVVKGLQPLMAINLFVTKMEDLRSSKHNLQYFQIYFIFEPCRGSIFVII